MAHTWTYSNESTMATPATPATPSPEQLPGKHVPDEFRQSNLKWMSYPENLVRRTIGMGRDTVRAYREELNDFSPSLFLEQDDDAEVCFRDFGAEGMPHRGMFKVCAGPRVPELSLITGMTLTFVGLSKLRAHSEEKMLKWLGIERTANLIITKEDPKSRFIYIRGPGSLSRLHLTRSMMTTILSYHQVMPEFLDFITNFGHQERPFDIRFSGFRRQVTLRRPPTPLVIDQLGRSGKQYQVVYSLKSTKFATQAKSEIWRMENAVFYHQFDIETGRAVWIVMKGGTDIYDRYRELTSADGRPEDKSFGSAEECFTASLAPHVLFCQWSINNWRQNIRWLEKSVQTLITNTSIVYLYSRIGGSHPSEQKMTQNIRAMQGFEDSAHEAIVMLEGNLEVISSLKQLYEELAQPGNNAFPPGETCKDELLSFINQLNGMSSGTRNMIMRFQTLARTITHNNTSVMQIFEYSTAERTLNLSNNMQNEAMAMRIITIVTLIYLPATFVSTFFGTDIIKYEDDSHPNGKYSGAALKSWLAISLPLTVVTGLAAWTCMDFKAMVALEV
ncbi:hypothetical protein QBC38DRAFT_538729 [Podospora fimiseda]|uniref:CorA-like transporter domain-containing protein n=1 Tax=Podospora fimiseda TaxID=252190 RepID=A0AAN7GT71_9PEZI|nr:hypothetical protein QBC38DRAFT_538729 [Podospora fimiseda]